MIVADDALDLLDTLVDGFEFDTSLDRSVALAALITAVIRPRLRSAPMFVGGTRRLAGIAAAISGRPLATLALSGAAASADVTIRSALAEFPPVLMLDATWWTGSPLGDPALAAALAGDLLARVPGSTRVEPVRTTIFAVGPVPLLTRAIAGSVLSFRMRDPGFDPTPRAARHRDLYRAAAEEIAGSSSDWNEAVRAPLVDLGLPELTGAIGRLPVEGINR